ncbi:hypothetical protein BKA62DRAFT_832319 [Auriculariales sp. MPI-PUGE-AT-0066]|nr:hypothetical protein BKA62DRAFT_832319 [Auriculariales sp. MPI-PUGE-AT-0066]
MSLFVLFLVILFPFFELVASMLVNVQVDDISPLITYNGKWTIGSVTDDEFGDHYSNNGTFHVTQTNSGSATLNFVGNQVTLFGAKRYNHGEFTVALDGNPVVLDGHSDDPQFQLPLFSSPVLTQGPHTFVVQDSTKDTASRPYFDVDFFLVQSEVDDNKSVTIQDDAKYWSYAPEEEWTSVLSLFTDWNGKSGHSTRTTGSTAKLSFTGTAIDLYGIVCAQCGNYGISLDDGEQVQYNAYNPVWNRPQSLIYMGRGLKDGPHTVTITNLGAGTGLGVDYAVIYGSHPDQPEKLVGPTQSASGKPTTAVIVAATVIPVFFILIAVLVLVVLRRRRIWPFPPPRGDSNNYARRLKRGSSSALEDEMHTTSPMDDPEMALAAPRPLLLVSAVDSKPPLPYEGIFYPLYPAHSESGGPQMVGPSRLSMGKLDLGPSRLPTYREAVPSPGAGGSQAPESFEKSMYNYKLDAY